MEIIYKKIGYIIVVFLGLIPLYPLLHAGLPITHDGQDHVARIANFYLNLTEGNIIPRWASNLNWGYGHPVLMFLYPFPSYFSSFFHFMGFSFVNSVKIVFGISFVLSGIAMYIWIKNVLNDKAGILAGVIYMLAPYRLVDLYVRGAIGEHVAFIFAPLVFYFLYKISLNNKNQLIHSACLSIFICFLLLSHNALSIMFLIFAFFYSLILVKKNKNKFKIVLLFSIFTLLGFSLSSFFLFPAFIEGKYTLRNIVTGSGEYKTSFVAFKDFFIPSWSFGGTLYLSKQIGIIQILTILISLLGIRKIIKNKNSYLYFLSVIILLLSLFFMLPYSNFFWEKITILQKFQFPWRLLSLVVFSSAIISSFSILLFKNVTIQRLYILLICVLLIMLYAPYFKTNGYLIKPNSFYTSIYKSTTDTGESSPIWSVRFMEKQPNKSSEFIDGTGVIKQKLRTSTKRVYEIKIFSKSARIRENTLYFPNWQVYVNGKKTEIIFQDPANRGLITYNLYDKENNVVIVFKDTLLRKVSNTISVISFIFILIIISYSLLFKKYEII